MTNHSNIFLDQNELDIILAFEENLENIFSTDTKVVICPSEEEFVSLAIEIEINFSLSEVISLLKMPFDIAFRKNTLKKSILLFQNAVHNLNQIMTNAFDLQEVSIYFKNTSVSIHSVERNSIVEELEFIISAIIHHFEHYSTLMGQVPNEIHIPVIEDINTNELFNKNKTVKPINLRSPYSLFWGLYFDSITQPLIYNLDRTTITPGDLDLYFDK